MPEPLAPELSMPPLIETEYDWDRADPYTPEQLFGMVDRVVERNFYGLVHPLSQRLLRGELTREELRFVAAQEYHYYWGTTWWNAFKIAHSDTLHQQRRLHGPLLDELGTDLLRAGGSPAHAELFLNYCEGTGISRDEVRASAVLPSVLLAVTELMRIASTRPQFEFIACSNLVAEKMRPIHYQKLLAALREHYTFVPAGALEFYEIHAVLDEDHVSTGRRIVGEYIRHKREQDAVMSAVVRSLALRLVMYDGIELALRGAFARALRPWPNFPREPWPRPST
jgi:pyrroloquinoline quinone (PQQ) biosynthesis protein C